MRLLAVLAAAGLLLTVPTGALGADHPSFSSTITTTDIQKVVDGITAVPQVQQGLGDGDVIVIRVGGDAWHGSMSGGHAPMLAGDAAGNAILSMSPDVALALANAFDQANTAKLVIQKHLFGVDGDAKVKAAANALYTGQFDSQLAAVAPHDGQTISFGGFSGALRSVDGRFEVTLGDRDFLVNDLGAIYGELPPRELATPPAEAGVTLSDEAGVSDGVNDQIAGSCAASAVPATEDLLAHLQEGAVTASCVADYSAPVAVPVVR